MPIDNQDLNRKDRGYRRYRSAGGLFFGTPGMNTPAGLGGRQSGAIFGILLVMAGVLFLLDNMRIVHIGNVWDYWPLILIAVGVSKLYNCRGSFGLIWSGGMIAVGVLFLLGNLGFLHVDFGVIWPLALIGWGVLMLTRTQQFRASMGFSLPRPVGGDPAAGVPDNSEDVLHEFSFFGGVKRVIHSQSFQGGELMSVFGGIEIDLRPAFLANTGKPIVIDANAAFGGINIKVPDSCRVAVRGVGVFGGYEDKTFQSRQLDASAPLLVITGYAAFGGVVIE
jgi:predicted membrane protein